MRGFFHTGLKGEDDEYLRRLCRECDVKAGLIYPVNRV